LFSITFNLDLRGSDQFFSEPGQVINGFSVHTRWIETEWNNTVEPFTGGDPIEEEDTFPRQTLVVEVGGRRLEVSLPGDLALGSGGAPAGAGNVVRKKPKPRKRGSHAGAAASGDAVTAPMQGTVVKVAVEESQEVSAGDLVVVLEAIHSKLFLKSRKSN